MYPCHEWADHAASFSYSPDDVKARTEVSVDHAWEFIDRFIGCVDSAFHVKLFQKTMSIDC